MNRSTEYKAEPLTTLHAQEVRPKMQIHPRVSAAIYSSRIPVGTFASPDPHAVAPRRRTSVILAFTAVLSFAALQACSFDTSLLESTTTRPKEFGETIARSADGLLELVIPAGGVAPDASIRIDTRRDIQADGVVGLAYTVGPSDLELLRVAELRMYLPAGTIGSSFSIVTLTLRGTKTPLSGSRYHPNERVVRAPISTLEKNHFALISQPHDPCAGLVCGQSCSGCAPGDTGCTLPDGVCTTNGECLPSSTSCEIPDGYDDPPGSGTFFVINTVAIAEGAALSPLGELMNDQIRQSLLGGEWLVLLEVSGLDQPYDGVDRSATLKVYGARDADDPFFPANNFKVPPGHTTCCEFLINHSALDTRGQARVRLPAAASHGVLSAHGHAPFFFPSFPFAVWSSIFRDVRVDLPTDLKELSGGRIAAVSRIADLAWLENPYCRTVSPRCPVQLPDSSMLDLIHSWLTPAPDVDLDGDGLETVVDTDGDALIDTCYDGNGDVVAPADPSKPGSCAIAPQMADGYSINFSFTAVAARLAGQHADSDPSRIFVFPPFGGKVYGHADVSAIGPPYAHVRIEARKPGTPPSSPPYYETTIRREEYAFDFELPGVDSGDELTFVPLEYPNMIPEVPTPRVTVPAAAAVEHYLCCMSDGTGTCQSESDFNAGAPCPSEGPGVTSCQGIEGCDALNRIIVFPSVDLNVEDDILYIDFYPTDLTGALLEIHSAIADETYYRVFGSYAAVELPGYDGDRLTLRLFYVDGRQTRAVELTVP